MCAARSAVRPLHALVIGAGPAAVAMHLPCLARLRDRGDLVLALVCDLDPAVAHTARAQFAFLAATTDALTAINGPEIDAVYVFASAQLHHAYGLAALRARKHVFVEKPIAPSYEQALELVAAARRGARIAVGGHNRRFYPGLARARAVGGWRLAEAVFHKPEFRRPVPFGAHTWLGANGIHALDALLYVMGGLPQALCAHTADFGAGVPSAFSALMSWADGRQAVLLCNNSAGQRREEYSFHAPAETWTITEQALTIAKDNRLDKTEIAAMSASVMAEHEAFLQAILEATEPAHSLAAIAPALYCAELIESGYTGQLAAPPAPAQQPTAAAPVARPAIVVSAGPGLRSALSALAAQYTLVALEEVLAAGVPRADVVAAILDRGAPAPDVALLGLLPNLAAVGIVGLSVTRYAPELLLARGIALFNASAVYAESVAEYALGLAILGRRRAFSSHQVLRTGGWGTTPEQAGLRGALTVAARHLRPLLVRLRIEAPLRRAWAGAMGHAPRAAATAPALLRDATVGLIGWGASARAFARRLRDCGARVLVYSEHAGADELHQAQVTPAALDEVMASDIVSLHRGLTSQTRHALQDSALARLRPGAVLINVARGALIEPRALLTRLQRGDVFACLDTYEEEPLPSSDPLRRLPNVFLSAHIAAGSSDMQTAAVAEVVEKVRRFLAQGGGNSLTASRVRSMT